MSEVHLSYNNSCLAVASCLICESWTLKGCESCLLEWVGKEEMSFHLSSCLSYSCAVVESQDFDGEHGIR